MADDKFFYGDNLDVLRLYIKTRPWTKRGSANSKPETRNLFLTTFPYSARDAAGLRWFSVFTSDASSSTFIQV